MCQTCAIKRFKREPRGRLYDEHRRNSDERVPSMLSVIVRQHNDAMKRRRVCKQSGERLFGMVYLANWFRECHELCTYLPRLPRVHESISAERNCYLIIAETYLRKSGCLQWLPEDNVLLLEVMACNMSSEEDSAGMDAVIVWWNVVLEELGKQRVAKCDKFAFAPVRMCIYLIN